MIMTNCCLSVEGKRNVKSPINLQLTSNYVDWQRSMSHPLCENQQSVGIFVLLPHIDDTSRVRRSGYGKHYFDHGELKEKSSLHRLELLL